MNQRLVAHRVSFAYDPQTPVFQNIDATIESGRIAAIVGPNGAGKSTLLRVLSGLLRPVTGTVMLNDKPLHGLHAIDRARLIAFLPQIINPAFALKVSEVVSMGRYPHMGAFATLSPHDRNVVERCLHDTETYELRSRDFMTLSGGERQRVLVASILAQEPELLLLDEPTSALDLHHAHEVFVLLRRLAGDGYGIAVVTHDLNLAARFCDHLLLMSQTHQGLLADGPPECVLTEELLSRAYAASINVCAHPITGSPLVTAEADTLERSR